MDDMKTQLVTFCKAEASAVVASVVDFAVTLMLAELLGLWYVCATFIGAVTGGVVNCMVNYRWVFSAQRLGKMRLALRYIVVWAGSIGFNTGFTYLVTELAGCNFIVSKVVVACLVAVLWNYQMQRCYVFACRHDNMDNNQ